MRKNLIIVAASFAAALTASYALEREASACGGCFSPPPSPTENPTVVTDHRMILTISQDQSTLYDQIKYSGNPSAFAWVLPIVGTVDVGLSADIVFRTLDGATTTSIVAPPRNCPAAPTCNNRGGGGSFSASSDSPSQAADAGAAGPPPVTITKQEQVGPYSTVQLHSTDAGALEKWLADNGFSIPADVQPVVDKYVGEHFDFLALKLLPGKNVTDMRPVRVTTKGAGSVLPLRMVAAGTGATVGISLWVLGEGRYEPQNFPTFFIPTNDIAWDWAQSKSDYVDLRTAKAAAASGRAWESESSTALYPQQIQNAVIRPYYGGYPGSPTSPYDPDAGTPIDPQEASAQVDYLPVKDAQGTVTKTAVQARQDDLDTLLHGISDASARVTRMRADLAHAALDADLVVTASKDQSVLSNVRQLTKEIGQPQCPIYSADGCSQVGTAPRDQAAARSDGGTESFSCATGGSSSGGTLWLGAGLGYLALSIVRARRRRNP